ncbi:MAG: hypothetical protein WCK86_01245 [Planctomycetia bacterium]
MSRIKPFLIGTTMGAAAMFFSLQYHVVKTSTGFQVVPRSPQQSIGLAYADIRNWSPSQWADRPELARALMANGSTDLIASSVVNSLKGGVPENATTLDELQQFLNSSRTPPGKSVRATTGLADQGGLAEFSSTPEDHEDSGKLIPFPSDAGSRTLPDPFQKPEKSTSMVRGKSRFSDDDVLNGLENTTEKSGTQPSSDKSLIKQAEEVERRIFGDSGDPLESSTSKRKPAVKTNPAPLFEEVTNALENQAQLLLNEIQNSEAARTDAAASQNAQPNFVRATQEASLQNPPVKQDATASESNRFDPFLE